MKINTSHLPLSFNSIPNKCLGTDFIFHVTIPKKVPSKGSFDPYWVVWFHTGLAKKNINKGIHNCCFRGTKYIIGEQFASRRIKLSIKKKHFEGKHLTFCFYQNWSKLGPKPLCTVVSPSLFDQFRPIWWGKVWKEGTFFGWYVN